jgi:hypothetical protein
MSAWVGPAAVVPTAELRVHDWAFDWAVCGNETRRPRSFPAAWFWAAWFGLFSELARGYQRARARRARRDAHGRAMHDAGDFLP